MDLQTSSDPVKSNDFVTGRARAHQYEEETAPQTHSIAERILSEIRPSTVLDFNCGKGSLVKALRRTGVKAFGVTIAEDTTQDVSKDVLPYCWVGSAADPLPQRYDLIVCLDALQNLTPPEVEQAIERLCQHTDDVLLALTPSHSASKADFTDRPPSYWAELFARHSFFHDLYYDASFAAPWAVRFRKAHEPPLAIAAFEDRLWLLEQESEARRDLSIAQQKELLAKEHRILTQERTFQETVQRLEGQVEAWETRWADLERTMGWALLQWLQHMRARLAPPGSKRDQLVEEAFHALRALGSKASIRFVRSVGQAVSWRGRVLLWKLKLMAKPPLRSQVIKIHGIEPRSPVQVHQDPVEIIVCVHNALSDVQRCLDSVVRNTTAPYSLILVDDGSAAETRDYLAEFAKAHGAILLRNEEPRRYTRAANQGLQRSSADCVVLLNSDTLVTPQWLDRMIACAESEPKVGMVGPLSNTASWQSIPEIESIGDWAPNPLPAGVTVEDMARLVARYSGRLYPRMPFLNGFCLLVRRQVMDEIGFFDEESFGEGYGEENDYALRARKVGLQLALADDSYVYHAQSRSYSSEARRRLSEQAGRTLARKHGQQIISEGVSTCQQDPVLAGIRARSRAMVERQEWIEKGRARFFGRRVLFVLPIAAPGGGGNVVIDEARAMQEMGVEVEIFNLAIHRAGFERAYPALEIPVLYGDEQYLVGVAHRYDVVVATANATVEWLAPIVPQRGYPIRGYYIQDFEPYMERAGTDDYQRAWESYTLFHGLRRFTKTGWTRQEVKEQTGAESAAVGTSVNIDRFRPRPRSEPDRQERPIRIAAMIRPESPYRAPRLTMELLQQAFRRYGDDVEIMLFGTTLENPGFGLLPRDFAWKLAGVLSQDQVARFLNEADLFVDFSSHQAMGLTALEAMACGATVIVPRHGGATSFAHHEENSLVIDTSSPDACWHALQRLIENHGLRSRLQRKALIDACDHFVERPAYNILSTLFGRDS